jgi:pimeloyl-ACP methyl ester carboxylesterase
MLFRGMVSKETPPDVSGVTHEWVDAGGLRTHVALAGPEDAPPIVLVHGWPQNWWAWRHLIPTLATTRRVICPDLRGFGWSDAPRTGYDKEQFATDVLALLDALGVQRATWVGHDWGAWSGMLAALRAPERFDRVFVLAVPHLWTRGFDPRRLALLAYQGPISMPLLGPLAARVLPRAMLKAGRARGKFTDEELDVYTAALRERPYVTVAVYRTMLTRELPALLRGRYAKQKLEVTTTVLAGGKDLVTGALEPGPVEGQPCLDVDVIEGAGHWLLDEAPEAVLAVLSRA